jgi:hypothetical protein
VDLLLKVAPHLWAQGILLPPHPLLLRVRACRCFWAKQASEHFTFGHGKHLIYTQVISSTYREPKGETSQQEKSYNKKTLTWSLCFKTSWRRQQIRLWIINGDISVWPFIPNPYNNRFSIKREEWAEFLSFTYCQVMHLRGFWITKLPDFCGLQCLVGLGLTECFLSVMGGVGFENKIHVWIIFFIQYGVNNSALKTWR